MLSSLIQPQPFKKLNLCRLFFILLIFNSLLSWFPWTIWQRFWIYPLALLLQLILFFFVIPTKLNPTLKNSPLGLNSFLIFVVLSITALLLRLYGLVSVPTWPTWDDADYSYFAIKLQEKWDWSLFIGHEKTMPLFTWLQGLFFKAFEPSLFSMWLYPALLSLLVVLLGRWAVRQFFPSSFSLLYVALLAIGFWPVYYGRFDAYLGVLQWVIEMLLLGVLGLFLQASSIYKIRTALFLGICVGFSFYSSMLFVLPAIMITIGVYLYCQKQPELGIKVFLTYFIPALVLTLPMDTGFLRNLTSGHVFTYSLLSHQKNSWARQWATSLSYFTSLFWGPIDRSYWAFAPLWGGFFNPLWDSLFFIGLTNLSYRLGNLGKTWWVIGLGVLFLPAFCFNTLECFRTDLIMPLCLVAVAEGSMLILSSLTIGSRTTAFLLALAFSVALDGYHLFGVFHRWSVHMIPGIAIKSPERYKAYQTLNEIEKNNGPGFIFTDFVSDIFDQSLLISTYPFNASDNPRITPEKVRWVAVLFDLHYFQIVQKRFPASRLQILSDSSSSPILCLGLIPISCQNDEKLFLGWNDIHQSLENLYGVMPYVVENPDFTGIVEKLQALYPAGEKDPLLKAWILEKMLDLLLVSPNMTAAEWFLNYPIQATRSFSFLDNKFAGVYHRLGLALIKNGDLRRASECFQRASRFDPKYDLRKYLALCR